MGVEQLPLDRRKVPQTRPELEEWIRSALPLSPEQQRELAAAIDAVFGGQQRLWQESKEEAIRALSTGFADKLGKLRGELSARDATVSSIAKYFENLVGSLTEKSHRDPKTKLMNFEWFMSQLESCRELEQRGPWSAGGLVDIHGFKWYNDVLGHAAGDRIIERVAWLLREQIRSDDLIAQKRGTFRHPDLHARFGGDEFCFLIPDLGNDVEAQTVAERFREGVEGYDWATVDRGLSVQPVRVDVGVVCLWMGSARDRRVGAKKLAAELLDQADKLMYGAKGNATSEVYLARMRIQDGRLLEYTEAA
jgi:diguanylate cyclase (GGDEF)-like protein